MAGEEELEQAKGPPLLFFSLEWGGEEGSAFCSREFLQEED